MKNKKDKEECLPKDPLNSTPTDMLLSEHTKTLESTTLSQNNNSKLKSAESKDIDLFEDIFIYSQLLFTIRSWAPCQQKANGLVFLSLSSQKLKNICFSIDVFKFAYKSVSNEFQNQQKSIKEFINLISDPILILSYQILAKKTQSRARLLIMPIDNNYNAYIEGAKQPSSEKTNSSLLYKQNLEQQNSQKLKHILKTTNSMEETSNNTNLELHKQGKQLQEIAEVNKDITKILKKTDKRSKQMTSWWYYIGQKVKGLVYRQKSEEPTKSEQPKIKEINFKQNNSKDEKKETPDSKMNDYNGLKQNDNFQTNQQLEEALLDQICNKVTNIKNQAKDTNKALTQHCQLIDDIDKGMEKNSQKFSKINTRLNKKFF